MEILLLTIGASLFLACYIWTGIIALKLDPEYGRMVFFSGIYRINFCRANWQRTKIPCSGTILGMVLILVGIIL